MIKVWYDINGEYAEEFFEDMDKAFEAFDRAIDSSHHEGDYVEIYDLDTEEIIEWFENGEGEEPDPDYIDDVDECGFNPYSGCYDYDC